MRLKPFFVCILAIIMHFVHRDYRSDLFNMQEMCFFEKKIVKFPSIVVE